MPDASGRFCGISVPELPWMREKADDKPREARSLVGRCIGCRSTDYPYCMGCGADLTGERKR